MTRQHLRHTFSVLLLAGTTVLAGCGRDAAPQDAPPVAATAAAATMVETVAVQPTAFEDAIRLTGSLATPQDAVLSAEAGGTLTLLQPLGSAVQAGQAVAQIDAGRARAAVAQAAAQVEAARAQYDLAADTYARQEALFRDEIISALEFENAKAQRAQAQAGLAQAQAALAQARQQLGQTRLVAPFAGTVEEHFAQAGEQVSPGTQVARVVNTRRVVVEAGVPERYARDIAVGTPVEVRLSAYDAAPRTGRVRFAGSTIDPESRTFPIEVELDNSDGALKPAMVAELRVSRARLDDVLVVPQRAVVQDETGAYLFVAAAEAGQTVARRRDVVLGPAQEGRVVVTAGLTAGDAVIVTGQHNLTQGDIVAAAPAATALPHPA